MNWNQEANSIFLDAIEIGGRDERVAFVEHACGERIELRREVLDLLESHEQADSGAFLEQPALGPSLCRLTDLQYADTSEIKNDSSVIMSSASRRWSNVEPTPLSAGDQFGRYRIERVLGKGAMGLVYLATDTRLKRSVALKIPRLHGDPELGERFEREARVMASITHRNLCAIHDIAELDGVKYMSMAFIDGETLAIKLNSNNRLSNRATAELMKKLALATHRAHRAGVVHRDLKPANVMMDHEGEPVILDFGLALGPPTDARLTQSGLIMGTPAYMAPEQAVGEVKQFGPTTDIYSLGAIMYELLTGQPVYSGSVSLVLGQLVSDQPSAAPRSIRADVDPALEAICLKAMSRRPADRYSSAGEFAAALEQYLDSEHLAAPNRIIRHASAKSANAKGRRPFWIAAATLGGLFFLATIVILVQTSNGTLIAEIDDDAIAAQVQGQKLTIRDTHSQRTYELILSGRESAQPLPVGEYRIQVTEPDSGLRLSADTFQITRTNRKSAVTVRFEPRKDEKLASTTVSSLTSSFTKWTPPEKLGPGINTESKEENACISDDGLVLVFARTGDGSIQLWESRRQSVQHPFGAATPLPEPINLPGYDHGGPFLGRNSLSLWFASNRPGGFGQHDLWVSRRTSIAEPWSEPTNLGPQVNTFKYEQSPYVSADELTLLFSGDKPQGVFRVLQSTRATREEPFSEPKPLANVNNGVCSSFPRLTSDGLAMIFVHCPTASDPLRLFVAHRKSLTTDFDPPVELDSNINSLPASGPSLSADGRQLYYCRQLDGTFDLWTASLAP